MQVRINVNVEDSVNSMSPADLMILLDAINTRVAALQKLAADNPVKAGESSTDYVRRMRDTHGGSIITWKHVHDARYEFPRFP